MTDFLREKSLKRWANLEFPTKCQKFLDLYDYWPTEDELAFPDLYQPAIEKV